MKKEPRLTAKRSLAAPDWRVSAGPRNKPTQRERGSRSNTRVVQRLVRTLHDGKGSHHVAKQKSEDQSKMLTEQNGMKLKKEKLECQMKQEVALMVKKNWHRPTSSNKPTLKEREEHQATHVTKQQSEDQSRRPTIAMDYYFMKMKSVVRTQNTVRRISNLQLSERRQTSEFHEQCCVEKWSRRTVDN